MYICYLKLITNYFKPQLLSKSVWPMNILTLLTGVSIIACQSFFAYRVYRVGRKCRYLVAVCMVLLCAELAFCIVIFIDRGSSGDRESVSTASIKFGTTVYSQFEPFAWMISVGLGIATVVDTVLAAVLIYVLHTSRTGLKKSVVCCFAFRWMLIYVVDGRTNSMLDTLIAYAVCTGLLTDIFNVLGFAFALRSSDKLIYAAFNIEVAKIYTNSVLSSLNFRRPREPVSATYEVSELSDIRVAAMGSSASPGSFGNVYHAKAAPRPDQSAFGPLNSVIEINVPGHPYASRTPTTTVHGDDHGHVDDVEANRRSGSEKEHGMAY
ncbi:hypothetical protein GSI_05517 [Ganoderma sinense ZZ0214-1]|uniref:DUF6534 domain-containing protein n=1 Tax=Ganoderma sinense ZZ0214-1 TaxID=1077348 RepID=A0A2G8SES1_9APHY|nr:hypothetical protein GSI_05517 [Ganoderma sinense ZZ0214-1]